MPARADIVGTKPTACFLRMLAFSSLLFCSVPANANSSNLEGCEGYPYQPDDTSIEFSADGKFKIITTAAVYVDFDEGSVVQSAIREAELVGKRVIAEYINQKLSSADAIEAQITNSRLFGSSNGTVNLTSSQREEVEKQLSIINTRSDAVLKGVSKLGSCYTKGSQVRVTVAIKSETVTNAEQLGTSMGANAARTYGQEPDTAKDASQRKSDPTQNRQAGDTKSYTGGQTIKNY